MSPGAPRSYNSPRRRAQAEQTRAAVLEAAARLFSELGWAGTSMRGVAAAAGVSLETVYAGFGSKADLLGAVIDVAVVGDDLPIPLAQRDNIRLLGTGTLTERVDKAAATSAAISGRTYALTQALLQGAATDALLAERLAALDKRRRAELAGLFEVVAARPAAASEVDEVWLLTSAEAFHMLVHRSGWSSEQHQRWLAHRLLEIITREPDDAPPRATARHKEQG